MELSLARGSTAFVSHKKKNPLHFANLSLCNKTTCYQRLASYTALKEKEMKTVWVKKEKGGNHTNKMWIFVS